MADRDRDGRLSWAEFVTYQVRNKILCIESDMSVAEVDHCAALDSCLRTSWSLAAASPMPSVRPSFRFGSSSRVLPLRWV